MLPPPLRRLVRQLRFWTDYLFQTSPEDQPDETTLLYPELAGCELRFVVAPAHELLLGFGAAMDVVSLRLAQPGAEPGFLAVDDRASGHVDALRWEELELFCRNLALTDPSLPHPGAALLLLCRFAPLCGADDAEAVFALVEEAWGSLGLSSGPEFEGLLDRLDRRAARFAWERQEPFGWTPTQPKDLWKKGGPCLHSFRTPGDEGFPAEAFEAAVAAARAGYERGADAGWLDARGGAARAIAERIAAARELGEMAELGDALRRAGCRTPVVLDACAPGARAGGAWWVLEWLLGAPPGSLLGRALGPTRWRSRPVHHLQLTVPVDRPARGRPGLVQQLDEALRAAGMGRATVSGSRSGKHGQRGEITVEATVHGNLAEGLAFLGQQLGRAQAAEETLIRWSDPEARQCRLAELGSRIAAPTG